RAEDRLTVSPSGQARRRRRVCSRLALLGPDRCKHGGTMRRLAWCGLLLAGALVAAACTPVGPGGSPQPTDCAHWRYGPNDEPAPGTLPAEFDRHSYKNASERDTDPTLFDSPHNQCGQKGPALDLALGVTQGRDDVRIAVLDS